MLQEPPSAQAWQCARHQWTVSVPHYEIFAWEVLLSARKLLLSGVPNGDNGLKHLLPWSGCNHHDSWCQICRRSSTVKFWFPWVTYGSCINSCVNTHPWLIARQTQPHTYGSLEGVDHRVVVGGAMVAHTDGLVVCLVVTMEYINGCWKKRQVRIIGHYTYIVNSIQTKLMTGSNNKSDGKRWNTRECLDQYACNVLRLWNSRDRETV